VIHVEAARPFSLVARGGRVRWLAERSGAVALSAWAVVSLFFLPRHSDPAALKGPDGVADS
jgi:hypothetical protein